MELIRFDIDHLPEPKRKLTLVLGNFDGLHLGHQSLFLKAKEVCEGPIGVLLFSAPWQEVLTPRQNNRFLSSLEDKIRLVRTFGIDVCYIVDATKEFFGLSPQEFVEKIVKGLGTEIAVVGEDYTYGKGGLGTSSSLGEELKTAVVPLKKKDGEKIASRSIKSMIQDGDIEEANENLGRPYEIVGTIMQGFQNGAKLGFKTANLSLSYLYVLPKPGVYAGVAYLAGIPYRAMINVGTNPTVGKLSSTLVEAHLLDYGGGPLYGETMYLDFYAFERPEIRFDSLEALRLQLQKDKAWADRVLSKNV